MTCEEFLNRMDARRGASLPDDSAWLDHGRDCPSCALALMMEQQLLAAPAWAPAPSLSPERRGRVLAEARIRTLYIPSPLRLFEESAVTALAVTGILVAAVLFFSRSSDRHFPAVVEDWLLPALGPVLKTLHAALSTFAPLAASPSGALFLLATAFAASLAAVLSLRVLTPRSLA